MAKYSPISNQDIVVISEHSNHKSKNYLHPFVVDEVCLRKMANPYPKPIIHFWTLPNSLILGMSDTKLPFFNDALKNVIHNNYYPVIRNAGGLAVVNDEGILNISLTFHQNQQKISISQAYEWMKELISKAFPEAIDDKVISSFEVSDSYCPGDYDLSIQGQKFAGIAQRRFKDGICVLIYLSIFGDQSYRGSLVKSFYDIGLAKQSSPWSFPKVRPTSMANLSDLLALPLSLEDVSNRILLTLLDNHCTLTVTNEDFYLNNDYQKALDKMVKRNQLIPINRTEDLNEY